MNRITLFRFLLFSALLTIRLGLYGQQMRILSHNKDGQLISTTGQYQSVSFFDQNQNLTRYEIGNASQSRKAQPLSNKSFEEVKIFPNPTEDWISIELPSSEDNQPYQFRITDLVGKVFKEMSLLGGQTYEVSLQPLSEGAYIVEWTYQNSTTYSKILKLK